MGKLKTFDAPGTPPRQQLGTPRCTWALDQFVHSSRGNFCSSTAGHRTESCCQMRTASNSAKHRSITSATAAAFATTSGMPVSCGQWPFVRLIAMEMARATVLSWEIRVARGLKAQ